MEGLGHKVLISGAADIRRLAKRRQKNERRDTELILDLPRGEFLQMHRPPFKSREVLRLLRYRYKLVRLRTRAKNSLQALAFSSCPAGKSRLLSREGGSGSSGWG